VVESQQTVRPSARARVFFALLGAAIVAIGVATVVERFREQGSRRIVGDVVPAGAQAFPDDAVVHVAMADVSRQDAEAVTIDEVHVSAGGRPAVPFEVRFDPRKLDRRHDYALQVRVTISDELVFMNTQSVPLQPFEDSGRIEVAVDRVDR
jgi:putative lipoprotein